MTVKTTLAALVLTLAPSLALAEGCNWMKEETASISCADGTTLDTATNTCVAVTSS